MRLIAGSAITAIPAAIGRPATRTISIGARAARCSSDGERSKTATSRGSHAVAMSTGTTMSVWNSFVLTPYQPTTVGVVMTESIAASIQR